MLVVLFRVAEFDRYNMNFTPTVENCPVLALIACHVVFEHTRNHCGTSYHLQEGRISLQFLVMVLSRKYLNSLDL